MEGYGPLVAIAAFFIGGVPFGVLAAKICGAPDPRHSGSQNIGFTNSLRVSGKKVGALTLLGDFGKGFLMGGIGAVFWGVEFWALVSGFAVICGHIFSPFLKFQGGKGVATALGSIFGLDPFIGLSLIGIWLFILAIWKYSSGAAIVTFVLFPILVWIVIGINQMFVFAICVSGLILYRHKENIVRLINGTESQMGFKSG
jgi:glycerol-3-phosphate acyltransferase PlsY